MQKNFDTLAEFIKKLEKKTDIARVDKATKMLKASHFQLFSEYGDTHLIGVVKSQTDPDLVYSCRIDNDGNYACCTQNLFPCGGLRGKPCKHLLLLIIGLAGAGEISMKTLDQWVAKTKNKSPILDKNVMGETFLRYKGAESGEIDWRPTETIPEDYYIF